MGLKDLLGTRVDLWINRVLPKKYKRFCGHALKSVLR